MCILGGIVGAVIGVLLGPGLLICAGCGFLVGLALDALS
jgi:hypothetical protein